jgi:hypothetical protein
MTLVGLATILSVVWLTLSLMAFTYQLNYYLYALSKLRIRERASPSSIAFSRVTVAKAASLVWVHVFLSGVGLTALIVTLVPITPFTTSIGISLAGVGSITLTAKLVWLTWFSNRQYRIIGAALRDE